MQPLFCKLCSKFETFAQYVPFFLGIADPAEHNVCPVIKSNKIIAKVCKGLQLERTVFKKLVDSEGEVVSPIIDAVF